MVKAFVRRRGVQRRSSSACVATLAVGGCVCPGVISVTSVQVHAMSQNQRRHDLSVWSSGPLFGGFDTDTRCDLQTVLAVAFGKEFVELSRIRS